jgi:enamine deaminase RidA (YjgF/YER057c/UK114 family)
VSSPSFAETIEQPGCSIVLRRVDGPEAQELFFRCQPTGEATDAGAQAEAIYRTIIGFLESEGGSFESVVCETLFLRSAKADLDAIRTARGRVLDACGSSSHRPAMIEIEQPPLNDDVCLEVAVQAVQPKGARFQIDLVESRSSCGCPECAHSHGLRIRVGDEARCYASGLYGQGEDAYAQTTAMFEAAEDLLRQSGMDFRDVVRTWIHLREMDRDYGDLNRARRVFFDARGIDPSPASTGIGGGPAAEGHDLCLSVYAVKAESPLVRTVMTSPTLNEANSYGADFVRGLKAMEANKVVLHVSGTASIDEAGRTAHPGDFDAQADRMLTNVAALLEGQGASFRDIVSAVTYLKRPADAQRLREKLRDAGYEGFPNVLVRAPICRPELLCETEAMAVLPSATQTTLDVT